MEFIVGSLVALVLLYIAWKSYKSVDTNSDGKIDVNEATVVAEKVATEVEKVAVKVAEEVKADAVEAVKKVRKAGAKKIAGE
jgi:hypothetical protein